MAEAKPIDSVDTPPGGALGYAGHTIHADVLPSWYNGAWKTPRSSRAVIVDRLAPSARIRTRSGAEAVLVGLPASPVSPARGRFAGQTRPARRAVRCSGADRLKVAGGFVPPSVPTQRVVVPTFPSGVEHGGRSTTPCVTGAWSVPSSARNAVDPTLRCTTRTTQSPSTFGGYASDATPLCTLSGEI